MAEERGSLSVVLVVLTVSLSGLYLWSYWNKARQNPRGLPFPPGPPRKFIVGNLSDIPKDGYEWLKYEKLAETYGDVMYFNVLGNSILTINSYEAATELLDKKGAIYSDRPRLPMVKELLGWDWNLVLMSYSEGFATHRRIVQQKFQPNIVTSSYRPVMVREVKVLLSNLTSTPDNFYHHLKSMAGAIIMMITYGHRVAPEGDEYVRLAEEVRDTAVGAHGSQLVDLLPILKYVPAWFPGAQFQRYAIFARRLAQTMRNKPFYEVKERLAAGTAIPSLVSTLIEENFSTEGLQKEELIKNVGGVIYSAGADTTVTALANFFLAMMLHPDVQAHAQKELDEVVGHSRLPEFSDRADMPYMSALVKETLRWKAVAPLGVVHCLAESDEYRGAYIPKSTVIMPNIAAMLHDKSVYENPDEFEPARFLPSGSKASAPDPSRAAFGFGRRICPGRFFADDSLWVTIACVLHTFHISHPKDADGRPVDLKVNWASGLVSPPSSFPCIIRLRPETEHLVSREFLD